MCYKNVFCYVLVVCDKVVNKRDIVIYLWKA